jgi:large conductance mechanosensitive channel
MLKDFRDFIMRGNVLDLAVGIIIGAAFTTVVSSLVNDVLMPPIGLLLSGVDFSNLFINLGGSSYATLADAQAAGAATINYGLFVNSLITFLITALAVFLVVRSIKAAQERTTAKKEEAPAEPTEKECPFCHTSIPVKAIRCPHCTSELSAD